MFTDEENKAINASTLLAKKVEKLIKYQTLFRKNDLRLYQAVNVCRKNSEI